MKTKMYGKEGVAIIADYFLYLVDIANPNGVKKDGKTFFKMLRMFYETEFPILVYMDDNRAGDGEYLRVRFEEESYNKYPEGLVSRILDDPPNSLEVFVGIAKRFEFITYKPPKEDVPRCFWEMMHNAGLEISDEEFEQDERRARDIVKRRLYKVLNRKYDEMGNGSLFPLKTPGLEDRRKVEIWYQLNDYVIENFD